MRWLLLCLLGISVFPSMAGTLLIYTESSPPYHYLDNSNQVVGPVTEKVRRIVAKAGFDAEIRLVPWARALRSVRQDSNALIFSIAKTPSRDSELVWIAPVASFRLGLVSMRTSSRAKGDNLNGQSIATQRNDIAWDWLKSQGYREGERLIGCADITCSWQHLVRGQVESIIEDPLLVPLMADKMGMSGDEFLWGGEIEALTVTGYLAANNKMPGEVIARLLRAAAEDQQATFDGGPEAPELRRPLTYPRPEATP